MNMTGLKLGLAAAAAVCVAGMASAQPDTGHIMQQYDRAKIEAGDELAGVAAQKTLYDYGECVAKARRRQAKAFVAQFPFSKGADEAARRMVTEECLLQGELSFSAEAVRGPVYQALYRKDFDRNDTTDLKGAPIVDYAAGLAAEDALASTTVNLRRFGDCTVRNNSAAARALAFSEVDSAAETEAFASLMPAMGGCVVQGDSIRFTRPLLRAVLAETLYRLSDANAQAAKKGRK